MRACLIVAVLILAMMLPHLPGRFDASATTVSFLAQLASIAGVFLLVPAGIAWALDRTRSQLWLKLVLGFAGVILFVLVIAAIAVNHLALGVMIGAVCAIVILKARKPAAYDVAEQTMRTSLPLYLVVIPIVLVAFRAWVLPIAADWSRTRAIHHSTRLIHEIELFRNRTGHYPISLQSLHPDVATGVVGIERFLYEPNGESYNLFFVRPSVQIDAREVVMFNPRDEHRFTAHALDLLQHEGAQLDLRRGDRRRTQLAHPHWVSILFD